ncbi:glycosyltransferase family 4 protein [Gammaproteobacteria bacterium]|nr:glycosyltransferase family 4 protein [Gammaproteobacteria bacterium]MDC1190902.1 glycosyltransferase family 4 protein [Gammaproteobacteria bacterium]
MNSLKILILSYRSAPFGGGQGIYVRDLSKSLIDLGHNVTIFSGPPYPFLHEEVELIESPGLNLFETFSFKDRFYKFINHKNKTLSDVYEFLAVLAGGFPEMRTFGLRAKKHILKNNYDLIIDNQSISYSMEYIQILTPFIEVIHHPITMDFKHELETNNNLIYRFSRIRWYSFLKMQKKVAPLLQNILTPSHSSKRDIVKDFKVTPENISVIHNAVNTNIFKPYSDINKKPYRLITTASADVPLKGLDFTLHALSALSLEFKEIELLVIGSPREGGHTERLIKDLDLKTRVNFKTNLTKEEIAQEYAMSSIAIVSSLYEGFGYPVAEAMACATPLVATNVASIPEITGKYAILIPPKDSYAIADSIRKIFIDPNLYNIKAQEGRKHIQEKFNWTVIGKQYEELMRKVIKDHKTIIRGNNANL